ncbi:hypothetical protein CPB86DRAFT_181163 [Serendipita vermifera]|nr:hypothetical protein CPB86DRAFT_181163 [Serendipita vermifera]
MAPLNHLNMSNANPSRYHLGISSLLSYATSYSRYSPSAIHLPPPPLMATHTGSSSPEIDPLSPSNATFPQSLPSTSPHSYWPSEYFQSSAATPAPTEGSADPAQSDQEDFGVHTSTSPSTSTSTSISPTSMPTASRWARFRIPTDIFIHPPDPARHQLYHQIRQEPWFIQQQNERQLTSPESSRIPGSIPGESVLLAFYDRVIDGGNRAMMRCTICAQTNPTAQLYQRPDRAKVHMRHHFELRPIMCQGHCNTPHCSQRFFTHSDLTAHVNGKTEPLASCPLCGKMMRQKNMKRHTNLFCPKNPDKDLP